MAGVSRSAAVCIAFLMKYNDWDLQKAYDFLRDKRPCVAPNLNFMGQLLAFQEQLHTNHSSFSYHPNSEGVQTTDEQDDNSLKSEPNVKSLDESFLWPPAVTEKDNDVCCGESYKFSVKARKGGLKLLIPAMQ